MSEKATSNQYFCKYCEYSCSKISHWKAHLLTKKHALKSTPAAPCGPFTGYNCICGKKYTFISGLSRHKKSCSLAKKMKKKEEKKEKIKKENQVVGECTRKEMREILNMLSEVQHQMQALSGRQGAAEEVLDAVSGVEAKVAEMMKEQNVIINDLVPRIGNQTTNNNFNLQIFLNDTCRDAINMSEFLASLKVHVDDLKYTQNNGIIHGISSVLVNGLRQLETTKRPIHCTDVKRETLYIKENNEWEREDDKSKIRNAIEEVANKHRKAILDWENQNPGWEETSKGMEEYVKILRSVMYDYMAETDENKIIKNVAKETVIDK